MRSSCVWVDLDRFGGLDRRPARGSAEVDRGGVSRHPSAKGLRGLGECGGALPLSARSPVRAAFCALTGLRDGCGAGGEGGSAAAGASRAIVMPVPAQIVWSGCPDQTGPLPRLTHSVDSFGPERFKEDPPLLGGRSSTRTRTDERLRSGAHTSRLFPILDRVVCEKHRKVRRIPGSGRPGSHERPGAHPRDLRTSTEVPVLREGVNSDTPEVPRGTRPCWVTRSPYPRCSSRARATNVVTR